MDNKILELYIKDNALLTQEVCEMLEVSRQQVNKLVKQGRLTPIKGNANASIFLKADIDEYLAKKHSLPIAKHEIIGEKCTRYSMEHFKSIQDKYDNIVAVHVYSKSRDAILDGYYTYEGKYQRDALLNIVAPTCVLVFSNGEKTYYDGFNCGYAGTGPHGTEELLLTLGVRELDAAQVLTAEKISYYRNDDDWHSVERKNNIVDVEEICLYNDTLVMIANRSPLEECENYGKLLNKYEFFIPRPNEVYFLSEDEAVKTGHYSAVPYNRGVYRLIIKDFSGNELWLKNPGDEGEFRIKHKNIETVLKEIGFEIPEEEKKTLPDRIKAWLGLTPIVANKIIYKK